MEVKMDSIDERQRVIKSAIALAKFRQNIFLGAAFIEILIGFIVAFCMWKYETEFSGWFYLLFGAIVFTIMCFMFRYNLYEIIISSFKEDLAKFNA